MTHRLLAASLAAALLASAAQAADLPARTAPPMLEMPPVFTWTGFYAGLNVGYGFDAKRIRSPYVGSPGYLGLATANLVPSGYNFSPEGIVGGGQIGFNYQLRSTLLGLEADFQGSDISSSAAATGSAAPGLVNGTSRLGLEWFGTVRGRIGFLPTDRFLVYGTGGLIYGEEQFQSRLVAGNLPGALAPASGAIWAGRRSDVRLGWTAGGGFEYALPTDTFLNVFRSSAVTFKAEALYYQFERERVTQPGVNAPGIAATNLGIFGVQDARLSGVIARVGVNYKFGTY